MSDFDPFTVVDPYTGQPPTFDAGDDDGFDVEYDDDELETLAGVGDLHVDVDLSVQAAQQQLGRRIVPREVKAMQPYVAEQARRGHPFDARAALDAYYADNPRKRPDARTLRRERMAAAIEDANPRHDFAEPPGELPAGAGTEERREHRRARMAWAMEAQQQGG